MVQIIVPVFWKDSRSIIFGALLIGERTGISLLAVLNCHCFVFCVAREYRFQGFFCFCSLYWHTLFAVEDGSWQKMVEEDY